MLSSELCGTQPDYCYNGGTCRAENDKLVCDCKDDFSGDQCQFIIGAYDPYNNSRFLLLLNKPALKNCYVFHLLSIVHFLKIYSHNDKP